MNNKDFFQDQIIAISKACAYDAIAPKLDELGKENAILRSENAQLKIRLKGSQEMCEALKEAFNSVRPEGAQTFELTDNNDLKDVL
jgi:regulator of replication initiation timing